MIIAKTKQNRQACKKKKQQQKLMIDFSCGHSLSETLSVVGTVKPMIALIVTSEAKNTRIQSSHCKLL